MPFSHNGLKATTGIQVFSQVNKYTLSYRFYMEMSKGVSLLRNAQSLLTGRTILLMVLYDQAYMKFIHYMLQKVREYDQEIPRSHIANP